MKVTDAVDPVTEETQLAAAERVRQSIGGARRPFERLTRLAAGQLNTPMAGITLVGPAGTTLLALTGFSLAKDEELIHRLCRSCLQQGEPMEVAHATALAEGPPSAPSRPSGSRTSTAIPWAPCGSPTASRGP